MAAGFGIGMATAYRYVREVVALLVAVGRGLIAALRAHPDALPLLAE